MAPFPIHDAARNGHTDTVKLLLERGATKDVKTSYGKTPIHLAAENGHTDTVKLLLSAGANPYITNNRGETAIDVDTSG